MFDKIITDYATNKKLVRLAKSAARNVKLTTQTSLEKVNELAFWLAVYGHNEQAIRVCTVLEEVPFTGNFNLWSWVETGLALKVRLLTAQGEEAQTPALVDRIREAFTDSSGSVTASRNRALTRRLNGELLNEAAVEEAESSKDRQAEKEYRFANLRELVFMSVLGASKDDVEAQIQHNMSRLQ